MDNFLNGGGRVCLASFRETTTMPFHERETAYFKCVVEDSGGNKARGIACVSFLVTRIARVWTTTAESLRVTDLTMATSLSKNTGNDRVSGGSGTAVAEARSVLFSLNPLSAHHKSCKDHNF